jgi:hypothetical protein
VECLNKRVEEVFLRDVGDLHPHHPLDLLAVRGLERAEAPNIERLEASASTLHRPGPLSYGDFIEPKNVLDKNMREAILKLEKRGEESRRRFEQDHMHESWFQEWDAMAESAQATESGDQEQDASLWCNTAVSETGLSRQNKS